MSYPTLTGWWCGNCRKTVSGWSWRCGCDEPRFTPEVDKIMNELRDLRRKARGLEEEADRSIARAESAENALEQTRKFYRAQDND